MVVQHNLTAMNANRMLGLTTGAQAKSTEKLSSGYKINRAADDAAGLSISEKMRKQIRGLTQASANAEDGISAVQTAEGALNEVQDMLQRMNELAVKAANGTMSETDRTYIQNEIDALVTEIDRVSETTKFNETYLLKGSGEKSAQVKATATIGTTTQDAEIVAAHGNKYSGVVNTGLAAGTEETATITYKDADGNTRTKDITFKVGSDSKTTANSLAEAIADDDALGKVFKAEVDETGRLLVESKLNGNKTDNTKNVLSDITFKSETGAALKTEMAEVKTEDAISQAVEFTLTDSTGAIQLVDANSITIDGKTYTYDSGNTVADDANSFKSLDELQELLGDDYAVSLSYKQEVTYTEYAADDTVVSTNVKEEEVKISTNADIISTGIDDTDFTGLTAAGTHTNGNAETIPTAVSAGEIVLTVARKTEAKISDSLTLSLQVGADTSEENKISIDIESMSAVSLGVDGLKVDGKNSKNADAAVEVIAAALEKVSAQRSALGAVQNRLEHTIANLDNVVENTTAAESQIRDTDMATEMVKYSNNNILAQAGQSMLAQANQSNQGVLSLLG